MPISTNNGFSKDELDQCRGWLLPDISNGGEVSATVKKTKVTKKNNKQLDEQTPHKQSTEKQVVEETIETIEDIASEKIDTSTPAINADQLQAITEAAEKEGFDTGFKQGLQQGRDEGLANGLQEGKQRIQDQSQRLQHIVDTLLNPIENEHKQLEQLLVDMTCRLAETVIERELKTDSSQVITLVEHVLSLLPQTISTFSLTLNPDDVALVESHLENRLSVSDNNQQVQYRLKTDEKMLPGGCRLESSQSSIDASVETKIKTLFDNFVQQRHTESIEEHVEICTDKSDDDKQQTLNEKVTSQDKKNSEKQNQDTKQKASSPSNEESNNE